MATIRTATETDLPALAQLWHENMILQPRFALTLAPNAREAWVAAARGWLDDPRCGLFAAERDGRLVGYAAGWLQALPGLVPEEIGLIRELALDAHGYHGGVGRSLVDALRGWFAAKGAGRVAVWTPHFDAVAQAFWRSLGASEWVDVLWIR
jgi:GNAT superfamily N-acetyltransferase